MLNEELIKNYEKAVNQKYNAVCFDIDGTLTSENSTKIDKRVLPMLANILKRYIPVVFITGRGETGLNDLVNDVVPNLIHDYNVSIKELQKIYALTNDGARIFMTSKDSDSLFNVNEYVSTDNDFNQLAELNNNIVNLLKYNNWDKYFNVTYSKDLKTNRIINIRLITFNQNVEIENEMIKILQSLIFKTNNQNINLTIGMHNGNRVLQIGTATKDKAILVAEKIIGIPQNSMLRVGDCGDENGNDYSMLNCSQGFSVDKISSDNDKCFPVIVDGKIQKGVTATLLLMKQVKLLPTICLEHAIQSEYTKEYANVEEKMEKIKSSDISSFDSLIETKFGNQNKVNDLYDKESGSIKIPIRDWVRIENDNPLKQLWSTSENNSMFYSMYDNDNILLRGSKLYYYFLAHRCHNLQTKEDITSIENIFEWLSNSFNFYSKVLQTINNNIDVNNLNNVKMILGIIDNIRNNLLILLNQQIVAINTEKSIMLNLENIDKNTLIYKVYMNLLNTEKFMEKITFNNDYKINLEDVKILINNVFSVTQEFKNNLVLDNNKNYSKEFRAYREIDNFAENFITCKLTMKKDSMIHSKGLCGLCYGGIELPIIMKSTDNQVNQVKAVSILKFSKNAAGYTKRQSLDLRFFDIFKSGGIDLIGIDKNQDYILLDDNLLTGKTMQIALTTLYDVGINVDKIIAVKYPKVTRIDQMFMENHGALDYRHFSDFIDGLYFPSPYSRRDPFSSDLYEDSLGHFDLNREKIKECLFKNGDYSKNSEVFHIKMIPENGMKY